MTALLAIAVILWLLRYPMPECVRRYFIAQLLYIIPVIGWARLVGLGPAYGWVYSIFSCTVLLAAVNIVWTGIRDLEKRWEVVAIPSVLAIIAVRIAYLGLGRSVAWFDAIALTEAAVLLWAGTIAVFLAGWLKRDRWTSWILGTLWLAQAGFRFGYCLHWPRWERANWTVQPWMAIVAFFLIGLRLRQQLRRECSQLLAGIARSSLPEHGCARSESMHPQSTQRNIP